LFLVGWLRSGVFVSVLVPHSQTSQKHLKSSLILRICCLVEPLGKQVCWKSMPFSVKSKPLEIYYLEPTPRRLKFEIYRHRKTLTYSEPNEIEAHTCGICKGLILSFAGDVRQKTPPWTCAFWERPDGVPNCDFWTSDKPLKSTRIFCFLYVSAPLGKAFCWKSTRRV